MSIYVRNGMWYYDIRPTTSAQKKFNLKPRYRGSTKTTNKEEAEQIELKLKLDLTNGIEPTKSSNRQESTRMTLEAILWETYRVTWVNLKSGRTFYSPAIKAIIRDMPKVYIDELDNKTLFNFIENLKEVNSPSTINQKLGIISQALTRASKLHGVTPREDIEFKILRVPKATKMHDKFFTKEEEQRILKYFDKHNKDIKDLLIVLIDMGARFSNVLNLKLSDCDFKNRTIKFTKTKNNKDIILPMSNRVYEILEKHNKNNNLEPFSKLNYNMTRLAWARMRDKFGWPSKSGYKLHALRHTCATRLAAAGVDIRVIQEWLGHSDIRMTMRYTQVIQSQLNEAMKLRDGHTNSV